LSSVKEGNNLQDKGNNKITEHRTPYVVDFNFVIQVSPSVQHVVLDTYSHSYLLLTQYLRYVW